MGPSGASITATLGGETVLLAQTAKAKAKGTPANFSGSVTLKSADYPADEVTNIGKVTYVVSMGEEHAVQSSPAEVFVAGISVPLTLEIPKEVYLASVLTDLKSDDSFTQTLKSGGRAAIKGRATAVRDGKPVIAYKLSGGGFILGDRANIVTEGALCGSSITELAKTAEGDEEIYEFRGGQPAVLTEWGETTLKLRFLNTKLSVDVQTMVGGLIQKVEQTDTADGAELLLTFDAGSLWGYDITHGGEATTLYLRRTPKRSEIFGKPLAGISVMLDPGHGGSDPGALGVAGSTGPTEAVLNMSVASLAKLRLEQLGARVTMTRADESVRVTLDERTFMAQQQRPHIFLSIHHNSTALTKDLAEVQHMESYYRENTAAPLSDSLMKHLTDTLGRKPGESQKAYFYVTRLTFAPSVLFEMGFIVNPAQYENA
ncbi:MAG: N-acetylmuramoyl-L-alanine amidase, partial [Angelakisella sp.]